MKEKLINQLSGNQLIISSFDSGSLSLSSEEKVDGWIKVGNLAVSPELGKTLIPYAGFDEWWVFKKFSESIVIDPFVNFLGFLLMTNEEIMKDPDLTTDNQLQKILTLQLEKFWKQIISLSPIAYIADGDNFNFVTKRKQLFDIVRLSIANLENPA